MVFRVKIISAFLLAVVSFTPASKAADEHALVFLPSYFKCTFDDKGKKACRCWDTACNPVACPTDTPWTRRPECPKGENCAPYAGEYGCRINAYDGHARPSVRQ